MINTCDLLNILQQNYLKKNNESNIFFFKIIEITAPVIGSKSKHAQHKLAANITGKQVQQHRQNQPSPFSPNSPLQDVSCRGWPASTRWKVRSWRSIRKHPWLLKEFGLEFSCITYSFKKQPIKTLAPGKQKLVPFCSVTILQKNKPTEVSQRDCEEKKVLLHLSEITDYKLD